MIRAGVIRNLKSHRNQSGARADAPPGVLEAVPEKPDDLYEALAWFAKSGVDLVVIDGGDGTVRDVLTRAPKAYGDRLPTFGVIPNGKTNALALDLGVPLGTPVRAMLAAARDPAKRKLRACLEVVRPGETVPEHRGFLFGMGAFVRGTELAQKTHGLGFFDNAAIVMTILSAAGRTLAGGADDPWRRGEPAALTLGGAAPEARDWFLVLAATLKRFPLGLKPFGPPHEGLKVLAVEAPPLKLPKALPALLAGSEAAWLEQAGYRRRDVSEIGLAFEGGFTLDGEIYPGGELIVRQGPDLEFVVV
ncbi:acylglycerol kinase family protein [Phenylobacterium sp. J426]|uniref:diacylglycerol/lipid kinase family protein n=1 Tax=Phenylobacterium sp. J426 TaxID=2898439 RepID=UPI002150CDBB|nr:acylglycerol kinase family protein [Phenylobacterium sp. J426]MCR5876105.1 acylglycerol kinase family protein [Phenylobacterium sp. J426]